MNKWNIPNTNEIEKAFRKVQKCTASVADQELKSIIALSKLVALVSDELYEKLSDGFGIRNCKVHDLYEKYLTVITDLDSISKDLGFGVSYARYLKIPSEITEDEEATE